VEPLEDRRLLAAMSFQDGVLPTPDYNGTRDVPLFRAEEGVNFGDEAILRADAEQGSTGEPVWSLRVTLLPRRISWCPWRHSLSPAL